ncbi:acetylserotonin O-methyltransferase-like [Cynara cardunculus var. scolymus]|uniref:Caffeate O-methyltransferase (COMT) family n=1 Tax=Cynara cardunculus var. scolymus TaxID=59895 RepID=A0A103Y958_CYNCS|nr:acetylserotonin O-methyltransferase-like [Cynara cardunculus var. scolymus]KVI04793.1 Caffeate O-methyltransferase (COMT) family [Cynara cardunculus var. scolymus]
MVTENKEKRISSKEEEAVAQQEIWKYIFGFVPMALVKCSIDLGIPDILENHETPMTLAELASKLNCSQSVLYRIMRFLIHYKIFQEQPLSKTSVGYAQTPLSRLLTRHGENTMVDLVLLETSPIMLAPWHKLSAWVLGNGNSPFEATHGKDLWGFNVENPGHSKLFNDAMACATRVEMAAVIEGCPGVFEGLKTMVDVGGGDGTALRCIVEACPWIKGINYDLPHVVSVAPTSTGVEHVSGNMFDYVPKADAVYLLKVLHDWTDEKCIDILKNCRAAIPQDTGKLIIVDTIIGHKEDDEFKEMGLLLDMVMMAHTSDGKERTLEEWSYLFHEAGFTRYTTKKIQTYLSVFEVYP